VETILIAHPMTLQIRDGVGFLPMVVAQTPAVMAVEAAGATKAIKKTRQCVGYKFY